MVSGTGELVGDAGGELLALSLPEELRGWLPQSDETYILTFSGTALESRT